jgi:vancomycin permeability regulator SanA
MDGPGRRGVERPASRGDATGSRPFDERFSTAASYPWPVMAPRWLIPSAVRFGAASSLIRPRIAVGLLVGLLMAALAPPVALEAMQWQTAARRYANPTSTPAEPVALVFGAGLFPDGSPTPILADRVALAAELYKGGRVRKLLMSGDHSRVEYDEVSAMRAYAIALGVPAEDVARDHAGLSTYESCYRARAIFGLERAILVTQAYHLPRAVYTCRALGIDASGIAAPDWGVYGDDVIARYTARESLAALRALWQVHVSHPAPTFLGPRQEV